jgi:PAS domain S-box-containing protein
MHSNGKVEETADVEALREEIASLRTWLKESEDVLRAIRGGEIDALVVAGSEQESGAVYTLVGTDDPYRRLVEAMQEGAVTLAKDGTVLYSNPSFAQMMRSTYDSIVGAQFSQFVLPADAAYFQAFLAQPRDGKAEMTLVSTEGSHVPVYLSRSAADLVGIQGICLVVTDLTDQKKHDEIVASERLARSILEQAAETIVVCDEDGRVTHASRQAAVLCGQNPLLKRFDEVYHLTLASEGPGGHPAPAANEHGPYLLQVARGETSAVGQEVTCTAPDGDCFHLLMSSSPLRGSSGQVLGAVIILADITESKRAAEVVKESERKLRTLNETLEERVAQRTFELSRANQVLSQKNRELQEFAHVASHDLQEPLRKISTFASLLRVDYENVLDDAGRSYIERMQSAASRMVDLIRDLLAFSRVETRGESFQTVDLGQILSDVLSDLEVSIREMEAKVEVDTLPSIEADPTQMRQLFQNLIANALKFHRPGAPPVLHVRGWAVRRDRERTDLIAEAVHLEVEDNGIGFDEKYLDRIFAPFQRLHGKSEYSGTGMGLAICRRIVERHSGMISAESTPGQGSRFIITLPLRQQCQVAETS